jgi:hypothetical protein
VVRSLRETRDRRFSMVVTDFGDEIASHIRARVGVEIGVTLSIDGGRFPTVQGSLR